MAFWLIRICSSEDNFDKRLIELKEDFLIPRGYKSKIIDGQFKRIKELHGNSYLEKRKDALKKKERKAENNNPLLPQISSVLAIHHITVVFSNPDLKKIFSEPPEALRQGPNLRKYLCRATLQKFQRNAGKNSSGWEKCFKPCLVCPFAAPTKQTVHSDVSKYTHTIETQNNCQSENVILSGMLEFSL